MMVVLEGHVGARLRWHDAHGSLDVGGVCPEHALSMGSLCTTFGTNKTVRGEGLAIDLMPAGNTRQNAVLGDGVVEASFLPFVCLSVPVEIARCCTTTIAQDGRYQEEVRILSSWPDRYVANECFCIGIVHLASLLEVRGKVVAGCPRSLLLPAGGHGRIQVSQERLLRGTRGPVQAGRRRRRLVAQHLLVRLRVLVRSR